MMPEPAVRRKAAKMAAYSEGCVRTSHSHGALFVAAVRRSAGAKERVRRRSVRALLKTASVHCSTAHRSDKNEGDQPRSSWRHLLATEGPLPGHQRLEPYERTGALNAEVTSISHLSGSPNSSMLFVQALERSCGTKSFAMQHQIELPTHYKAQERPGLDEHLAETGADTGHRVIALRIQLLMVLVSRGQPCRLHQGDPIVLLAFDQAASRLPGIVTNTVLEIPGAFESCVFNTIKDTRLAVLLEDLGQDVGDVIRHSSYQALRTRVALASRALQSSEGAEELAILPQDLPLDAAGLYRLGAMRLLPLRRLPSPASEKTRKNLCTSGWALASLPLVSQAL